MKPVVIIGKPAAATDWRCADPGCKCLLGRKHSHGVLIIKYKDFLAEVSGNYTVSTSCRRCGLRNNISSVSHGLLDMVKNCG